MTAQIDASIQTWRNVSRRCFDLALDLVFPPHCVLCGTGMGDERQSRRLCDNCLDGFGYEQFVPCDVCAAPLPRIGEAKGNCLYCRERKYRFHRTVSLGIYRGALRDAVLRMKKVEHEALMLAVGDELAQRYAEQFSCDRPDLVVPVPMHWWRRMTRGVNSSELLAEAMARKLGAKLVPKLLRLRRKTRKQGTLLPGERFRNVRGAFVISGDYELQGRHVLVVDDVMTTGATTNEIAKILRRAGAGKITIAVAARGTGFGDHGSR